MEAKLYTGKLMHLPGIEVGSSTTKVRPPSAKLVSTCRDEQFHYQMDPSKCPFHYVYRITLYVGYTRAYPKVSGLSQ
jgi:hypothetical protein